MASGSCSQGSGIPLSTCAHASAIRQKTKHDCQVSNAASTAISIARRCTCFVIACTCKACHSSSGVDPAGGCCCCRCCWPITTHPRYVAWHTFEPLHLHTVSDRMLQAASSSAIDLLGQASHCNGYRIWVMSLRTPLEDDLQAWHDGRTIKTTVVGQARQ